jgi:sulfite reductase (NADPH) hemoprotein beta-component
MSSTPKARPATTPLVFTGNRLRDGRVVWLGPEGRWVETLAAAHIFPPEAAAEGLALAQQGERQQQVVGVYGVEVSRDGAAPVPLKFRERLRAAGPSIVAEPAGWRLAS